MKVKAAVCRTFGAPLSIEDIDLRMPGPGEVHVRLDACAICHSDITYMDGNWGGELPAVYGHEAAVGCLSSPRSGRFCGITRFFLFVYQKGSFSTRWRAGRETQPARILRQSGETATA